MSSSWTAGTTLTAPITPVPSPLALLGAGIPHMSQNVLESAFRGAEMAPSPLSSACRFPTMEKRPSGFRPREEGKLHPPHPPEAPGSPSSRCRLHLLCGPLISLHWVFYRLDLSYFHFRKSMTLQYICGNIKEGEPRNSPQPNRQASTCSSSQRKGIPESGQFAPRVLHTGCLCTERGPRTWLPQCVHTHWQP